MIWSHSGSEKTLEDFNAVKLFSLCRNHIFLSSLRQYCALFPLYVVWKGAIMEVKGIQAVYAVGGIHKAALDDCDTQ